MLTNNPINFVIGEKLTVLVRKMSRFISGSYSFALSDFDAAWRDFLQSIIKE